MLTNILHIKLGTSSELSFGMMQNGDIRMDVVGISALAVVTVLECSYAKAI